MTDGNKTYKIRWEGSQKGRPTVLLFKDSKKINEELDRMHKLFEYNPRNNFAKSNLLTEEEELHNMMDKFRGKDEVVTGSTVATAITKKLSEPIKVGPTDIFYKGDTWRYDANNIGKMGDDEFWSKIKDVSVDLSQNFEPTTILSLLQRLGNSFLSHPTLKNDSKVKNWGATLKNEINLGQVSSYLR